MLKSRYLVQPEDFSIQEIDNIIDIAHDIIEYPGKYAHALDGKVLATLFFEPSTRTRLSFEAAMNRLGGRVIGFSDSKSSSTSKGESLEDTMRIVSGYADIIASRHPIAGAGHRAADAALVPFINAGDGKNQHPTQTLTDLITIKHYKGRLDNLTIGLCGDLKYGRTVHSLAKAMNRYENVNFIFISPEELMMPEETKRELKPGCFEETSNLRESLAKLDVLYMTRIQEERFEDKSKYERLKDVYILDKKKLEYAREDTIVLHPLPRVNEISTDVDDDPRTVYFEQAKLGMYVRMALILEMLGVEVSSN